MPPSNAVQTFYLSHATLERYEPTPATHPLFRFSNAVLTPHIAAGSRDALHTKMSAVFANIERFYHGEKLLNRIELG
jgi:phosphoglycerate dehydrogenase-like enzyme